MNLKRMLHLHRNRHRRQPWQGSLVAGRGPGVDARPRGSLRKWREVWCPIISRAIRCGLLRAPDGVLVASQPPQTHPGGVPNFSDGCARVRDRACALRSPYRSVGLGCNVRVALDPMRCRPCSGPDFNHKNTAGRSTACRRKWTSRCHPGIGDSAVAWATKSAANGISSSK